MLSEELCHITGGVQMPKAQMHPFAKLSCRRIAQSWAPAVTLSHFVVPPRHRRLPTCDSLLKMCKLLWANIAVPSPSDPRSGFIVCSSWRAFVRLWLHAVPFVMSHANFSRNLAPDTEAFQPDSTDVGQLAIGYDDFHLDRSTSSERSSR